MINKICIVGLGYIGLPTSAIFAASGINVIGVDISEKIVNKINMGEIHIEEPGLPELVKRVVAEGKLKASTLPEQSDAYIIAVPTPIHEDYRANVDYVVSACEKIAPLVQAGDIVIVESTIPPRTISDVVAPIFNEVGLSENDIFLAHCPERVLPGRILTELIENTRIVGGLTPEATKKAADLYRLVVTGDVIETDSTTAEMTKLMENTFRDVNIALANELVKISKHLGINAHDVIQFANKHPRVNLHLPGPGVGGHCLAVDPYFIIEKAPEQAKLIQTSRDINNSMPSFVVQNIKEIISNIANPKVAILGVTYKGNIDDYRESPALDVINILEGEKNITLAIHDPHVLNEKAPFDLLSLEEALDGADLAVILSDHHEFKEIVSSNVLATMNNNVLFDTKGICTQTDESNTVLYNFNNIYTIKPI
ncbi:nucleotide sugar dehydrogenase [Bacillus alkalisoli]|uniref:nucleotide sugar dehydrogenase n=1 Tax=Bacillus alkalisoli TaxID=2011008 RepID=UPI0018E1DD42|nr:nucleotide sugar dehydrogenase [Bacillus alkalisoli]